MPIVCILRYSCLLLDLRKQKIRYKFIPGVFPSYTERILPPEKINEKRSQEKQRQQKTLPHTWIHIKNGDYGKNVSTSLY